MPTAQHRKFDLGFNQDEDSNLLAEGFCFSSKNFLFDKIGIARKRGGISGVGATTNYGGDNVGVLLKDDGTEQMYARGYSGGASAFSLVNSGTGAFSGALSGVGELLPDGGRPFQHYGYLMFPCYDSTGAISSVASAMGFAGASPTSAYTFVTPASVAMVAGDKRITCAVADNPLTNLVVGQTIYIQYGTAFQNFYVGRITRLVSTTAFEVFPTPVRATAGTAITVTTRGFAAPSQSIGIGQQEPAYIGSKFGMSFQGRVVLANLSISDAGHFGRFEANPRGIAFSTVLLEQPISPTVSIPINEYSGALWVQNAGYPKLNTFNIPAQEAITAISPTGFGDAVIFSAFRTFRLTGNLTTQFGTEQSITWAVREVPNSVGCISERSMQRTPRGIVFAHDSGIYTTDGTSMHPLMYKRIQDYWKALQGPSFKIYGCALIRGNHYYICGVDGVGAPWGLLCNLDNLAWSVLSGKASAPASWLINSSWQDFSDTSRVWALKWWNQGGAAPSMTGGQLLQLETMFVPTAANRADSDGTTVNFEYITPPYVEGSPTLQKDWLAATVQYNNKGGAAVSVVPQFFLDSMDVVPGSGLAFALQRQDGYTVTGATTAAPVVITIGAGHDLKVDGWVRVLNVGGMSELNGLWRIQAVTATTVTLVGSVGIGTFGAGGSVRSVDQKDIFLPSALAQQSVGGQGVNPAAVVYRINDTDLGGAQGADEFELLAITHTWDEHDTHGES